MGQQSSNQTVTSAPPQYLQKPLEGVATRAGDIYNQQPGITGTQQQAIDLMTQRAQQGSPLLPAAQQQNLGTVQGDYLFGGPGFNAAYQAAANKIIPQVQSHFASTGRSRGGLAQQALGQSLADAFASQYGQERQLQQQATQQAPGLAQADYGDINKLLQAGGLPQDIMFGNLGNYANILTPLAGTGSQQTTPISRNAGSGLLGGALGGVGIANALGSSLPEVWGGLGGLVGLLSDRNAKKDIQKIGYRNGLNVYIFKYKNSNKWSVGYMADEVEKLYPEAVSTRPDGYKQVDYSVVN